MRRDVLGPLAEDVFVPTNDAYCLRLAAKLGTLETGTTTIAPVAATDADAARVIVSTDLYDAQGEADKFANCFAYLPQSGQVARCHADGFSLAEASLFEPPTSGSYVLVMNGYGTTTSLAYGADAATIQAAVRAVAGFEDATVVGPTSGRYLIDLGTVNQVDITPSTGTIIARGLGRIKATRPFSSILATGTRYVVGALLPRVDYDGWKGLRSFVNDALAQTPTVHRIPLAQTATNQTVFDLSAESSWLKVRKQVIGLYSAGTFSWTGAFTPPGSSTYTLSLRLGPTTYTTPALAFGAGASVVQAAMATAIIQTGVTVAVSGTSPMTATIATSRLYPIILSASGATVGSQATTEVIEPVFLGPGGAFAYRNGFPVFEADPFPSMKETRFLACYRRASTWIAPQVDWQTAGADAAFAASTTGLVGPADRAQPDEEQVANMAYAMVCEYLYDRTKDAEWQKKLMRVGQQALYASIFDAQEERHPGRAGGLVFRGWEKLPGGGLRY